MIPRRASPEVRTPLAYWRWMSVSELSRRRPVRPMTPFMGVRISWLIVARKSDFCRDDARASSRASASSASSCLRSVMSWKFHTRPTMTPSTRCGREDRS